MRYAHALADEITLTDEERHELAEQLLKVDDPSWAKLSNEQLQALVHAMNGWHYIDTLLSLRAPQPSDPPRSPGPLST